MQNKNEKTLDRRSFVKGIMAAGGFMAASATPLMASKTYKTTTKSSELSGTEFFLTIDKTMVNYTGEVAIATTVNGMLPAPTLKWREGDEITLHVKNNLNVDSSIHWHGIILPFEMDGVPGITFNGIKPGETFTYKFTVNQSGTYWYHSHSGFQEQTGVHGVIVIEPKIKDPYSYDKDYVISLSDWSDEKPENIYRKLKVQGDYYNRVGRTVGDFVDEVKENGFFNAFNSRKMWNEMSMTDRDLSDVAGSTYTYLMNGYNPASNFTAIFKKGEKIRLRFANSSAMTFFDIRIPGLKLTVVSSDGNNVKPVVVDEFRIGVAETYDVIVEPLENKAYAIFAQSIERSGYAIGHLTYDKNILSKIPAMDPLPILGHVDMAMDMGGMKMDGAKGGMSRGASMGMKNKSKVKKPSMSCGAGMKMEKSKVKKPSMSCGGGMNMQSSVSKKPYMGKLKRKIPITPLETKWGVQTTMQAEAPMYRMEDPGVGLRNNGRKVLTYSDLESYEGGADENHYPDREIILHLTGNMERYMWSINGIKYSDAKPLKFYYGERLRITYINDTMMNHPMHLHGLWSDLEVGDNKFVRKHTIVVQPGSKASIRVTVDARGHWAFHCHMLYHMLGMFRKVIVV